MVNEIRAYGAALTPGAMGYKIFPGRWLTGSNQHITGVPLLFVDRLSADMMSRQCDLVLLLSLFFPPQAQPSPNKQLASFSWPVSGSPRAMMFITHGYAEHISPYFDGLGKACGASGILCQGHDHIGHGSSPGGRTEVRSLREYTAPVLAACKRMRSEHPDLPLFLMGHSMGGLIALTAALTSPALFDGLLLTGPFLHGFDPLCVTLF